MTKTEEEQLAHASLLSERMYHEAHRIAAHGGAEPIEIAALTVAMATIWSRLEELGKA